MVKEFKQNDLVLKGENLPQLFEKRTVAELTDSELANVGGGTSTTPCLGSLAAAWTVIQAAKLGYEFGQWLR